MKTSAKTTFYQLPFWNRLTTIISRAFKSSSKKLSLTTKCKDHPVVNTIYPRSSQALKSSKTGAWIKKYLSNNSKTSRWVQIEAKSSSMLEAAIPHAVPNYIRKAVTSPRPPCNSKETSSITNHAQHPSNLSILKLRTSYSSPPCNGRSTSGCRKNTSRSSTSSRGSASTTSASFSSWSRWAEATKMSASSCRFSSCSSTSKTNKGSSAHWLTQTKVLRRLESVKLTSESCCLVRCTTKIRESCKVIACMTG